MIQMLKMSIQYMVLGFEPTTSKTRVSSHYHQTRAHDTISFRKYCWPQSIKRLKQFTVEFKED